MGDKKWAIYGVGCVAVLFYFNALLNYIFNPYEIFTHPLSPKGIHHVQRYEKIAYLATHHNDFNGYIIGSSRVGFIEPSALESYLPDSSFYNAWASSANPLDAKIFLEYLIEKHYPIKYALIQIGLDHSIDNIDYRAIRDMQRMWHYDVTHTSAHDFYSAYIFSFLPRGIYNKFKAITSTDELPQFEDIRTGIWGYTIRERLRVQDPQAYVRNEESFYKPKIPRDSINERSIASLKASLQGIDTLCKTHNIKCIIYTAPMNHIQLQAISTRVKDTLLRLMAENLSGGFWHFGYLNSITTNDYNYYEETHHIPHIDTLTLRRIFECHSHCGDRVPQDFGMFITKDNIDSALTALHQQESLYSPSR